MAEPDDLELVRRAQQGDERAFELLVERYRNRVFGLIVRTIADRQRADDLAQEVFFRVYRGLPYFRGEARFSTWLYRIVANLCHQARAPQEFREVALDAPADGSNRPRFEPGTRDMAFTDLELRDRLEKAMATLPPRSRLLVAGHYLEGVSYEDLAEMFHLPLGTVKTSLHRAKRRLRLVLEAELG